ncbi:MAG: hypothetical protein R6V27_05935 [Balneolaceae bacterium]
MKRRIATPLSIHTVRQVLLLPLIAALLIGITSCSTSENTSDGSNQNNSEIRPITELSAPSPDPRVGLDAGLFDAEEAIWNLEMLSTTPPPEDFVGSTNSDLAFFENYAIQGNYNGFIIWDISDPANPDLVVDFLCPASQSDVSVYGNLLFVSGEGLGGRLDCGTEGVDETVSEERLRGIRIFDISDIEEPEYISNVQTCRGSHTHSVLKDPNDDENIYVYVSGSAPVRPDDELPGCSDMLPEEDENSALFRIEVIKVPLDNPADAEIANSPRIFDDLTAPPVHGPAPDDLEEVERAREEGKFIYERLGTPRVLSDGFVRRLLNGVVEGRGGSGEPTAADSTYLRENLEEVMARVRGLPEEITQRGPNQCHDITLFPETGLAGGACEGYGLLLDIKNPLEPQRVDAVADSNFAYWHSATFNNDGSTVLFTDEWGGGSQPKCRETDPMEWGANAIYSIDEDNNMDFKSYFKMPAPQTNTENCVAHNGSMIPIPGRDIMVQSWYQGGINIFDFTDPENPVEIAFHDRGPVDANEMQNGGSWSIYWYNGVLVNSEISRGLDIFELKPSDYLTENEIEASKTVRLDEFNPQGQPRFRWPATFVLAHAFADQIERQQELDRERVQSIRSRLNKAERETGSVRSSMLANLASDVRSFADSSGDHTKVKLLSDTLLKIASES